MDRGLIPVRNSINKRHIYRVCQKKKDILNIHIKSEKNYYFFTKILLDRVYHICGQMSKFHLYSPITYYIALYQTLKRNYAVNGHEMYCTCVYCTCAILTYGHIQSQSC